jgi:hypothetical protein
MSNLPAKERIKKYKSDKTKNSKEELKADKEIKVETKKQTKEAKND